MPLVKHAMQQHTGAFTDLSPRAKDLSDASHSNFALTAEPGVAADKLAGHAMERFERPGPRQHAAPASGSPGCRPSIAGARLATDGAPAPSTAARTPTFSPRPLSSDIVPWNKSAPRPARIICALRDGKK